MSTILITGASKGIGFATALAFARTGHTVAAAMRNPNGFPELAKLAATENLAIKIYQMDVDSDASVRDGFVRINKEIGPIDVLVNNAGIERMGNVEELAIDEFRAVMETNYFGVIRCIHAVLPEMTKRRSGCIINIASVAGRIATPTMGAYSSSKFALEALSETLAAEVKSLGIHVAIVEPGIIDTDMARHITVVPAASKYSQQERLGALFAASLKTPVPPSIVADKILEIATNGTWQLRHPVGPDALPFIGWRQSMSDEAWVDLGAMEDNEWYDRMEGDFSMKIKPEPQPA